jgi:hypothetical protein
VAVGVGVGVGVAVSGAGVGVRGAVAVDVGVRVAVGVRVGVRVGVGVRVAVGVGTTNVAVSANWLSSAPTVWLPADAPAGTTKLQLKSPPLLARHGFGLVTTAAPSQVTVTRWDCLKPVPVTCTVVPAGPLLGDSAITAAASA